MSLGYNGRQHVRQPTNVAISVKESRQPSVLPTDTPSDALVVSPAQVLKTCGAAFHYLILLSAVVALWYIALSLMWIKNELENE